MLALVVYAMVLALVIGGFAAMLALRTGSAEAVQNVFPLTFISLFISSAFFPTESMHGIYQSIATRNPITWMIDGMRHQVIVGFDLGEAASRSPSAAVLAGARHPRRQPRAPGPTAGDRMTAVAGAAGGGRAQHVVGAGRLGAGAAQPRRRSCASRRRSCRSS